MKKINKDRFSAGKEIYIMENIWGPQRKTGNMEEESLREENRKAHEEDERFRMTAVKAAGQVRQRMRCATGESDESFVVSSCCPSGIF